MQCTTNSMSCLGIFSCLQRPAKCCTQLKEGSTSTHNVTHYNSAVQQQKAHCLIPWLSKACNFESLLNSAGRHYEGSSLLARHCWECVFKAHRRPRNAPSMRIPCSALLGGILYGQRMKPLIKLQFVLVNNLHGVTTPPLKTIKCVEGFVLRTFHFSA